MSNPERETDDPADDRQPSGEVDDDTQADLDAWKRTFAESETGLRRVLQNRLPQSADVDDCLQSVFIAMLNNTTNVPPTARRAWLFTVAAREAAKFWRQRATTDRVMEKHASAAYVVHSDTASQLEQQETERRIQRAIENLPEGSRHIVQLRLKHDLTFAAIAEQLQLPLGTVLTRMRRAMQRLRDELDDLSPDDQLPND